VGVIRVSARVLVGAGGMLAGAVDGASGAD
jgi:hypothetical protein